MNTENKTEEVRFNVRTTPEFKKQVLAASRKRHPSLTSYIHTALEEKLANDRIYSEQPEEIPIYDTVETA